MAPADGEAGSVQSIWMRLNARIGNPLDWSHANRALLIIVPTILFQSSYIWLEHWRTSGLDLPESAIQLRWWVDFLRTIIWLPMLGIALWLRATGREGRFFLYCTSLIWYADLGFANLIYEPFTTFIWITTVAVTLLLLIIVDWSAVIAGMVLFVLISESPFLFLLAGHDLYAPVLSRAADLGPLLHMDWRYKLFTLILFVTAVVIFMYTVAQWRDREQSLAGAKREVDAARENLERRVALRTQELESAYQALVRSEQNWEALFRNAPDYILLIGRDGFIEKVNHVPEGLTVPMVEGRNLRDFLEPPYLQTIMSLIEDVFSGRTPDAVEAEYLAPTGQRLCFEVRAALAGSPLQPGRAMLIAVDVTQRRETAARQKALEDKVQEKQRLESLGILAGGIAHDFNNLLTPVIGQTGLLLKDLPPESPLAGPVRDIATAATRAAEIIRQLLSYVGQSPVEKISVDLDGLIREMIRLLGPTLPLEARLELETGSGPVTVNADPAQLRQVVMNLITNAAEALEGKPGEVRISTGIATLDSEAVRREIRNGELQAGTYAFLEVADTGRGMNASTLARIFDPFFTTKRTGHGLGLAFLLGIVRAHGGAVAVASTPGTGTRFRIYLPPAAAPVQGITAGSRQDTGSVPRLRGTVLVVDDEPLNCAVASRILERAGASTLKAEGGRRGLELIREQRNALSCVLLDLTMPDVSGEEVLAGLRETSPSMPVLLMSGYSAGGVNTALTSAPHTGFIQKPFTPEELVRAVATLMGNPAA